MLKCIKNIQPESATIQWHERQDKMTTQYKPLYPWNC